MKAPAGVEASLDSGLMGTVIGTVADVNALTREYGLLHSSETAVLASVGYQRATKWAEAIGVNSHVAIRSASAGT